MKRRTDKLQRQVEIFNARVAVGDRVTYRNDLDESASTRTRTAASVLNGHTAVIWIEGRSGCVALERVTPSEDAT